VACGTSTACSLAKLDAGHRAVNYGKVPSPAVASRHITRRIPAIMLTGSHLPNHRKRIKFIHVTGEARLVGTLTIGVGELDELKQRAFLAV
jgi:phosphomannomutase